MSQGRRLPPPALSNQLADGMAGKICRADFKTPQMRQPAGRMTSESFSSEGSSLAPSPSPSPQPAEISGKTANLGKSFDSKGEDSDSGSFSAVVPESASHHEKYDDDEGPAQWEDRHYRSPYLESLLTRWRHDYATPVRNPLVDVVRGKPHVATDSTNEGDFISRMGVVDYIMDRIPEEIRNGMPVSKWLAKRVTETPAVRKRGRPRKNPISISEEPMPKCHKEDVSGAIESPGLEEPLFEEELKPPPMEEGFGDEFEQELKPEIVNGREIVDMPGPSTSADGSFDAHLLLNEEPIKYIIPAFALDKAPPHQEERDFLGVICALCDMTSINVSKPNWFRLILNKCELTLSQLTSIENRRRLELEQVSELKSRLKNRIAVLDAKRRCLVSGGQSAYHGIRTGSARTLAEGRGRPLPFGGNPQAMRREAFTARGISMQPSDTNQMRMPVARPLQPPQVPMQTRKPVMYKRYRLKDGRIVTVPANQQFPPPPGQSVSSTAALIRPASRPYFVVTPQQQRPPLPPQRRPEDGIPATELLDEDEPPMPRRMLGESGISFVTTSTPRAPPPVARQQVGFGFMRSRGRSPMSYPRPGQ